ncbi:MFS transporter [Paraconexibacter antarcticus]|uniref:MFS transporter n=1 Tax=Paraconexibacter antarcticus TaxID=2949664 RepID=A0ABY5E1P8_9ACTN|nr:MFS transporter [Paraconexibacter antarcticus]UTI66762.1 MFS transporter [Paraconexibacter antarcticus]
MTMLDAGSSWTIALPGLVLCGLGFGLANPTVAAVTLAVAPPAQAATATGMNSTFRQVGVATGVAAMGAIFDHALSTTSTPGTGSAEAASVAYADALHHVFLAGSAIAAVGAVLAAVLVRATPTSAPRHPSTEQGLATAA